MRKLRPFRSLLAFGATWLVTLSVLGQSSSQQLDLKAFADQKRIESMEKKDAAVKYANLHHLPLTISTETTYSEIIQISNNSPQYYSVTNKTSAATISTDKLQTKSLSSYLLDGSGIRVYEWDAGSAYSNHQEFGGRISIGDGALSNFHSTHIAGTILASGVNANAQGMAPAAMLESYEWNNDISEMASAAMAGALLSNHSYGFLRGWAYNGSEWSWYGDTTISRQEDYLFGFYDEQAHDWDLLAYNAPYYLVVKSAGNDRNEGPVSDEISKDGPYDCISNAAVAKNVLTVGAVEALPEGYEGPGGVKMSSFSCWGPTDDGRIKPDVVADGIGIYSTDNGSSTDYITLSGTSMATASVTGSLALLQQLNFKLKNEYLKAATLKGLVIGTANETGPADGPDYQSGWGLMDTYKAAELLLENIDMPVISEEILVNGGINLKKIKSDGLEPLKVTISWTDAAGTSPEPSLDPEAKMLVNDLDLWITSNGVTCYPWTLDAQFPSAPAKATGKNHADNVEVVYISLPAPGEYEIHVGYSGNMTGEGQDYSMIITGASSAEGSNEQHGDPQGTNDRDPNGTKNVNIYPNPATDFTTIETNGLTGGMIRFFDNSGKNVLTVPQSGETTEVRVSELPAGTYILLVENEDLKRISRMVKKY